MVKKQGLCIVGEWQNKQKRKKRIEGEIMQQAPEIEDFFSNWLDEFEKALGAANCPDPEDSTEKFIFVTNNKLNRSIQRIVWEQLLTLNVFGNAL